MSKNYVIIGFMGSGKTTVSRYLSTHYGYTLRDTDSLIERAAGKTIGLIFKEDGEVAFRDAETALLTRLCREAGAGSVEEGGMAAGMVISTGGGIVLREENRELLRQIGEVIYLRIRPETVLKRLRRDRKRPLLQGPDREKKVRELMDFREPMYQAAADRILDVDESTPAWTARIILGE